MVDENGKPAFNDQAGVDTLAWMLKTVDEGVSNPASISYVEEDVRNVFSQGKAAFALNWNYMYDLANNNEKESKVNGQVKVATIPVFEKVAKSGTDSSSINGSMGFSVVATSPVADQAWEYVKYLTSEDVQNRYSAHMLPIWESSFQEPAVNKLMSSPTTQVMVPAFKNQFQTAHVRPKVPYYPEGSKALQLAIQQVLTKQATPKEALDQAAQKWVDLAK
jgi:multiple sugar transport system substrate-binding protein